MNAREYVNHVSRAAGAVARLQAKRNRIRRDLRKLELDLRAAKRLLRLLAASVEPYDPPGPPDPDLDR